MSDASVLVLTLWQMAPIVVGSVVGANVIVWLWERFVGEVNDGRDNQR